MKIPQITPRLKALTLEPPSETKAILPACGATSAPFLTRSDGGLIVPLSPRPFSLLRNEPQYPYAKGTVCSTLFLLSLPGNNEYTKLQISTTPYTKPVQTSTDVSTVHFINKAYDVQHCPAGSAGVVRKKPTLLEAPRRASGGELRPSSRPPATGGGFPCVPMYLTQSTCLVQHRAQHQRTMNPSTRAAALRLGLFAPQDDNHLSGHQPQHATVQTERDPREADKRTQELPIPAAKKSASLIERPDRALQETSESSYRGGESGGERLR